MDAANWMGFGLGVIIIIGAWTNWLNYPGDERDAEWGDCDSNTWILFYVSFRGNRKAFREFFWITELLMLFLSIHTCPAVEGRLQSTPLS